MNRTQPGEVLVILLALAGALSSSFTVRAAGNYVNFYEALAGMQLQTVGEDYTLEPEVLIVVNLELRNPTPYQGLEVTSFSFTPISFHSPNSELLLPYNSYAVSFVTRLRDADLPADGALPLLARVVLRGTSVEEFRQFYNDQAGQITMAYEASVRVHTMLEKYCGMSLHFTSGEVRARCAIGSFGIPNVGL